MTEKKIWPFFQILQFASIVIAIIAVIGAIVMTNITLRSIEQHLPSTLLNELLSLDRALEQLSEVAAAAEVAVENPRIENIDRLKEEVRRATAETRTLRQTYVFDNLIQASAFHSAVAPALRDLQIWLADGVSGYAPTSKTTLKIVQSRISTAYQKAKQQNMQSRKRAQQQLTTQRLRLDRFLFSVNMLFLFTFVITVIMVVLYVRQHRSKIREMDVQQALQQQSDLLFSLFENIPQGITVRSQEGTLLYCNRPFTQLTGYTFDDVKDHEDWFSKAYPDPDYRQSVKDKWYEGGAPSKTAQEFQVTCKNGELKDIEFKGTALPDGRSLVTFADITARKQDEKRLQFFKTAVDFSSDAIGISDPQGRHWYQNRSFDELFGDIGDDPPATLYADESVGREVFQTIISGGQWSGEVEMTGKTGNLLNILLRAYAVRDDEGNIICLVGTHTDITHLKEAEKALLASEEKYRAVVENTPDLLYRTDLNGIITFISSSVYKLSGYTVDEAIGMRMAEEVYAVPEERKRFLEVLRQNGVVENFQAQLKRKDGSTWWAATNAHFFKDRDGNIAGVEGITRDVTDIKVAEAALKQSEQRMRAILEASPDPMVMYNRIGHPEFINRTFTEVFGWTMDDLKGNRIPFVPENLKKETWDKIKETYTLGKTVKFETKRLTKDGRVLDILLSGAVTRDNDDQSNGMVVNLTDITERKALEAQFEQAQKMESLGTLAGGIAHDFNNLLGGIFGYLDIARKKTKDPKIAEYLNKAFNVSERAEGLTHQLLTFSKGGAPIKKVEPLVPFLQETVQFALSGSNVSCRFKIPDDLWMCDFDRNQIGQVVDNIIINAQHAMPSGGNIHLIAENVMIEENELVGLQAGNYVRISIIDSGTGIPAKYLSRIFDPFFTTKQSGSGLGLATAYSIIKKHDGLITVDSEQGVGTTFNIYLPASDIRQAGARKEQSILYQGSGTMLLMDDDEMLLKMLVDMLEDMGFDALTTTDGRQALAAFKKSKEEETPFCALILDLTIRGGMGGKDTVKEIRKLDDAIPVFVASGYSEDDAIGNPEAYGFTDSLKKPFGIEQLTRVLKKHL